MKAKVIDATNTVSSNNKAITLAALRDIIERVIAFTPILIFRPESGEFSLLHNPVQYDFMEKKVINDLASAWNSY